jgi:hypothetical protein
MNDDLHVFGYGSLVDTRTHDHPLIPSKLHGWQRVWREVPGRDFAILSATRVDKATLDGAVMTVPMASLPDLDAREVMYERETVEIAGLSHAVTYEVQDHTPIATKPILRSYLDVVLIGYETMFGDQAIHQFYASTNGWNVGILDDRADPIYPRHRPINSAQAERFDQLHKDLTAL